MVRQRGWRANNMSSSVPPAWMHANQFPTRAAPVIPGKVAHQTARLSRCSKLGASGDLPAHPETVSGCGERPSSAAQRADLSTGRILPLVVWHGIGALGVRDSTGFTTHLIRWSDHHLRSRPRCNCDAVKCGRSRTADTLGRILSSVDLLSTVGIPPVDEENVSRWIAHASKLCRRESIGSWRR